MIQANEGKVIIKGAEPIVFAEVESLLHNLRKGIEKKHGKEKAEEIFNRIVEDSKKSEEQIDEEIKGLLKDILKTVMEGLGE